MSKSTLASEFPLTDGSLPRLKSYALVRNLQFNEVIQEARMAEWSLRNKECPTDKARWKYFWRAFYCRVIDLMYEKASVPYRGRVYRQENEYGEMEDSAVPQYEGQKQKQVRAPFKVLSLNDLMDKNSELLNSEAGLIDQHTFDTMYIQDLLRAYVALVTEHAEHARTDRSTWQLSLDILNSRLEEGITWEEVQEVYGLDVQVVRRHRRRLEKLFRDLVGLQKSTARITPGVSPNTSPVSVGY